MCVAVYHKSGYILATDSRVTDGDLIMNVGPKWRVYPDGILLYAGSGIVWPENITNLALSTLTESELSLAVMRVQKSVTIFEGGHPYEMRDRTCAIGSGATHACVAIDMVASEIKKSSRDDAKKIIRDALKVAAKRAAGCSRKIYVK